MRLYFIFAAVKAVFPHFFFLISHGMIAASQEPLGFPSSEGSGGRPDYKVGNDGCRSFKLHCEGCGGLICLSGAARAFIVPRVPQVCASMKERAILSSSCRVLWSVKLRSMEPIWLFSCRYVMGVLFMFTGFLVIDAAVRATQTRQRVKHDV